MKTQWWPKASDRVQTPDGVGTYLGIGQWDTINRGWLWVAVGEKVKAVNGPHIVRLDHGGVVFGYPFDRLREAEAVTGEAM